MAGQEGEWNQVKRKGRRLRNVPTPSSDAADSPADGIRPNPSPELSVDDLAAYHQTITKDWQTSDWWEQVRHVLESASSKPNCPVITKAVCLGPGPYEPSNGSSNARRTAHIQTAAFCFIVDHLKSQSGRDIKCVIQEPRFTQTDRDFCLGLGLGVVESPDAFSLVDENTLLFGIHMELDIYNQALAKLPHIYVGASLEEWEKVVDQGSGTEGPLAAFSKMAATYESYPFPDLDYMFSSTVVYWRRQPT